MCVFLTIRHLKCGQGEVMVLDRLSHKREGDKPEGVSEPARGQTPLGAKNQYSIV